MDPLTLVAAGISAIGSLFAGGSQMAAAKAQAAADQNQAQQAMMLGGANASEQVEEGNAAAARAAAQGVANGGGLVGSTLGVVQDVANKSLFNARMAAYRGRQEAVNDMYNAQVAKATGQNAMISSVVGAGSSLLGGFAKSSAVFQQQQALRALRNDGGAGSGGYGYYPDW